jgi:hypothetical protein
VSELPAGGGLEKVGPAEGSCTRVIKIRQLKFKIIEFLRSLVGAVARLVGIEGGVVSGVINLESSGVEASDWRPRHDEPYHEV